MTKHNKDALRFNLSKTNMYLEARYELDQFNASIWKSIGTLCDGDWTAYINESSEHLFDKHNDILQRLHDAAESDGIDTEQDPDFYPFGKPEPAVNFRCYVHHVSDIAHGKSRVDGSTWELYRGMRRIHGYGLAIHHTHGNPVSCQMQDHSPVLWPEGEFLEDYNGKKRHRMLFVEWYGKDAPPDRGVCRSVGDILCVDHRTAAFVQDAINEKIRRDRGTSMNRPWGKYDFKEDRSDQ